jgi:hypothetical protein
MRAPGGIMATSDIEARFHREMVNVYEGAKRECGYNATRFLQMVTEMGGLKAAKALLRGDTVSDGLAELWQRGRLDISVEALVLRAPWRQLFTAEELATAEKRLRELGYAPSGK